MTEPAPRRRVLAVLLLAVVSGCAPAERREPPAASPSPSPFPLILVSLDGFRHDYLERYRPAHLLEVARTGVRADALIPVFPTKTFPNHYTQVTGLWPEHHGIVGNSMYDPSFEARFGRRDAAAVADARWWGGEPLWVTAERQGRRSAPLFWPGSEAPIRGVRPTYWRKYDWTLDGRERVDEVLEWLALPGEARPAFLTLYFSDVDSAGHRSGPDSSDVARAVARVDAHLGRLLDGLARLGLHEGVNLLIVSDHGMAATDPERVIVLEELVDARRVRFAGGSPVLLLWPRDGDVLALYRRLDGAHPHLRVWRREQIPEAFHFRDHRRIAPIVAVADEGWQLVARSRGDVEGSFEYRGTHGYPPDVRSMHGILLARGPSFPRGHRVAAVEAIHLYGLMCALLELAPAPHDGDLAAVRELLIATPTVAD